MDPLQYDPRTKQMIKEALYSYLYDPVKARFQHRLDTIIIRNTLLGMHRHKSFSYKGETYSCDSQPLPRKRNPLLLAIKPEMDAYLKELKELNERELPYVLGFIHQVLNASNNLQDYLRLLPASVHSPVSRIIASCPCQSKSLSNERVCELQEQNLMSINLMKTRQALNLIM